MIRSFAWRTFLESVLGRAGDVFSMVDVVYVDGPLPSAVSTEGSTKKELQGGERCNDQSQMIAVVWAAASYSWGVVLGSREDARRRDEDKVGS